MNTSTVIRPAARTGMALLLATLVALAIFGCGESASVDAPRTGEEQATTAETPSVGSATSDESTSGEVSLVVGDRAALDALLEKHRGKVILVDYWATWCGPCTKNFPHTVELHRRYADRGFTALAVSLDEPESEDAVRKFLQAQGATFDNILSEHGIDDQSFEQFEIETGSLPHYVLYNRRGEVVRTFATGDPLAEPFTQEDIERAVRGVVME